MTSEESANEDTDSEATINSPLKIKKEEPMSMDPTPLDPMGHPGTSDLSNPNYLTSADLLSQTVTHNSAPQTHAGQIGGSPPGLTWEAPSRNGGDSDDQAMRNVLIWESEDFGPIGNRFQQQTVDQDNHGKS